MEKSRQTKSRRDYSGIFLVLILIGIAVVVLGLMMAVAQSARSRTSIARAEHGVPQQARFMTPQQIYH
jgi:hypothetical protein